MTTTDDGSYIFLDQEILSPEKIRTRKQANLKIRIDKNAVRVSEIHKTADDLAEWIREAQEMLKTLGLKPSKN
jgi:hypothetical protein